MCKRIRIEWIIGMCVWTLRARFLYYLFFYAKISIKIVYKLRTHILVFSLFIRFNCKIICLLRNKNHNFICFVSTFFFRPIFMVFFCLHIFVLEHKYKCHVLFFLIVFLNIAETKSVCFWCNKMVEWPQQRSLELKPEPNVEDDRFSGEYEFYIFNEYFGGFKRLPLRSSKDTASNLPMNDWLHRNKVLMAIDWVDADSELPEISSRRLVENK